MILMQLLGSRLQMLTGYLVRLLDHIDLRAVSLQERINLNRATARCTSAQLL